MFDVPELRKRLTERFTEDRKGITPGVIEYDVNIVMEVIESWLLGSIIRGEKMNITEYVVLTELLDFDKFDFEEYFRDEKRVLQPQLEFLGYTDINWGSGEGDSFGPLTRICRAKDKNGNVVYFMYG